MLLAVLFGVALASLSRMLSSVVRMGRSTIGVMGSLFVITSFLVLIPSKHYALFENPREVSQALATFVRQIPHR